MKDSKFITWLNIAKMWLMAAFFQGPKVRHSCGVPATNYLPKHLRSSMMIINVILPYQLNNRNCITIYSYSCLTFRHFVFLGPGRIFSESISFSSTRLVITDVNERDQGIYTCLARPVSATLNVTLVGMSEGKIGKATEWSSKNHVTLISQLKGIQVFTLCSL